MHDNQENSGTARVLGSKRSSLKKLAELTTQQSAPAEKLAESSKQLSVPVKRPPPQRARKSTKKTSKKCLYVLDTNVFMHDPSCIERFEEHDIELLSQVLGEFDHHKKGKDEINRNVRQITRNLDELSTKHPIHEGLPLDEISGGVASGRIFIDSEVFDGVDTEDTVDDQIIASVQKLVEKYKNKYRVVLVTKDANMRLRARAKGIEVEDYRNDLVIEDADLLYKGSEEVPKDFWNTHSKNLESWKREGTTLYKISGPFVQRKVINEFMYSDDGELDIRVIEKDNLTITASTITNYTHPKNQVWGITARNREQNYALNLLMDPEVDFVSLLGQAGTGKTLLTLAAGLHQIMDLKIYTEIIMTRITVPIGEDIGFLPGTEEEKMGPWMGALEDNLEVLMHSNGEDSGDWGRAVTMDLVRNRIKVKSLNFMKGRTFLNKFIIIDEAQNLTPKQMKALITRAGPGTKVVCLGNIAQIDTPYLTEGSSGLTHVVERFKGREHCGHVILQKGERSRLADLANEVL